MKQAEVELKMKELIAKKYSTMTYEQIAEDVMALTSKAIELGFDTGVETMRNKVHENVKNWERDQILKAIMGS